MLISNSLPFESRQEPNGLACGCCAGPDVRHAQAHGKQYVLLPPSVMYQS